MALRIELNEPDLVESLARFLVAAGYIAEMVDGGAVAAREPMADEATAAQLRTVLHAWCRERRCSPDVLVIAPPRC